MNKKDSDISESLRAIDGTRTRGLDLGKVARYQLRHYRTERVMGIEPTYPAWKAGVLPLNYTRIYFILQKNSGISESLRAIDGARTRGLDLGKVARYQLRHYRIKRVMGIEPTYPAWKAGVLPLNYTRVFLSLQR